NVPSTSYIYTLSLHDALPISPRTDLRNADRARRLSSHELRLLLRALVRGNSDVKLDRVPHSAAGRGEGGAEFPRQRRRQADLDRDRKSTRLNSSHLGISYAVF